jgi:hypothetical protein
VDTAAATPRPRPGPWLRPGRLRAHAALLALCLWGAFAAGISAPGLRDRSGILKGSDFLQFYVAGALAREGRAEDLYDYAAHVAEGQRRVPESKGTTYLPVYGPQVAVFFAPLARLPYGTALAVWLVASALLYAACVAAVWRTCPRLRPHAATVALLAVANPPLFSLIGCGQSSALALAAVSVSWLALRAGHRLAAGFALGCLAYKPQLALGAGLVLLAAGETRIVAGAALAGLIQLAGALLALGAAPVRDYAGVALQLGELAPTLGFKLHQMHSLRAFFELLVPGPGAPVAWAVGSASALALAHRIWRSGLPLAERFSGLLVAGALVNPHQYMYDLVILTPAWLLLADGALAAPGRPGMRGSGAFLYAAFLLPALGPLARFTHLQLSVPALAGVLGALAVRTRFSPRGDTLLPSASRRVILSSPQGGPADPETDGGSAAGAWGVRRWIRTSGWRRSSHTRTRSSSGSAGRSGPISSASG